MAHLFPGLWLLQLWLLPKLVLAVSSAACKFGSVVSGCVFVFRNWVAIRIFFSKTIGALFVASNRLSATCGRDEDQFSPTPELELQEVNLDLSCNVKYKPYSSLFVGGSDGS